MALVIQLKNIDDAKPIPCVVGVPQGIEKRVWNGKAERSVTCPYSDGLIALEKTPNDTAQVIVSM